MRTITEFYDLHLNRLDAKLLARNHTWQVDIKTPPLYVVAGVCNYILSRISTSTFYFDSRSDGQYARIGGNHVAVHALAGCSNAFLGVSGCDIGPIQRFFCPKHRDTNE